MFKDIGAIRSLTITIIFITDNYTTTEDDNQCDGYTRRFAVLIVTDICKCHI